MIWAQIVDFLPARKALRCLSAVLWLTGVFAAVSFATPAGPVSAAQSIARDARLGGDAQRTRFVADLSREVRFRLFTLADPYRVIIDLPDVKFQLPSGLGQKGRGLVAAFRYGLIAEGKARIVIDLNTPVLVDKAFVLPAKGDQPARLVVDLVRTDRKRFLAALKLSSGSRSGILGRSRKAPKAPSVSKRKDKNKKPVIVLDPGHGGLDPGAISRKGLKEKDVVFAFSQTLMAKLKATGRYKVVLTRTIDTYVALRDRVSFARKHGADLFLSIHADSLPGRYSTKISGATVYTLSEKASDDEAKALAAKENLSDVIAGVELPDTEDKVTSILIDLALRETKNLSITFADITLANLKGKTPLMQKAHRFAGFRVLKAPDVPSVLLELGYMSNPADTAKLTSVKWRRKIAGAIVKAVDKYFAAKSRGVRFNETQRESSRAN